MSTRRYFVRVIFYSGVIALTHFVKERTLSYCQITF
jgi:hypothetical protein